MKFAKLVEVIRNSIVEREHYGLVCIIDSKLGVAYQIGNIDSYQFFMHSSFKPFQAIPILTSGANKKFDFSTKELAICCASHSGTKIHTKLVESVLNKIGLDSTYLQCGIHSPIDTEEQNFLIKNELKPNVLHNNCSGKHAGMLAVCVKNGWNINAYTNENHPLQKEIFEHTKNLCNLKNDAILGFDGCGTPLWAMSLKEMCVGFLNLFTNKDYKPILDAFIKNPFIIGGKNRQDSHIIEASSGNLIAKVGAEGLCLVANIKINQVLGVKIADGNMNARAFVLIEMLKKLGWLNENDINSPLIQEIYTPIIKTNLGKTVGKYKLCF